MPYYTAEGCAEETHAHLEGVARVCSEGFDHLGFRWLLAVSVGVNSEMGIRGGGS